MEEKLYSELSVVSASSLEKGLQSTLTLIRVNAPNEIRKSLGCTNVIENMNGLIRKTTQRVRRWSNEEMIMRWVFSGIMESEKSFRQVKRYRSIQILIDRISNMSKIIIMKVALNLDYSFTTMIGTLSL